MTLSPPEAGNICALVVTFHPDSSFRGYIEEIRRRFVFTLIVDNGSKDASIDMIRSLPDPNTCLIEMGRNTGLGMALNWGIREARSNGYRWVVLFDQDTEPIGDMVQHFSDIFSRYPAPERIAVIGSRFRDRNRTPPPPATVKTNNQSTWDERRRVITSGSLISLDAYESLGPFREDLFIDYIDHEYCHRARSKGWSVLQTTATLVIHSVGSYRKHRLLGIDIWRSHHSAIRCYFIARNRMLLARERGEYRKFLRGAAKAAKDSFFILLLEDDKPAKVKATLSGYISGISGNWVIPEWIRQNLG